MDKQAPLKLDLDLPGGVLSPGGSRLFTVMLTNTGNLPVVVNHRMACGYREHLARELFAELFDPDTGEAAPVYEVDYDRNFSGESDYRVLEPGETIRKTIDLFKWYLPQQPGVYRMVMHYQADEPLASPPPDICRGIYSSEPVVLAARFETPGKQPLDDAVE